MKPAETFHLGLCMAGSVTAGAYTAGVIDYLIEALEAWEKLKSQDDIPAHQVVIDLICGSSGGGMTGAMTLFALMDKMDHARLGADGINFSKPGNNILWNTWVELNRADMLESLLVNDDIRPQEIGSLLNSSFIDSVAEEFKQYIDAMPTDSKPPPFLGQSPEMFMTLFNVTGINYQLHTRSSVQEEKRRQYVSDHRDLAHFRWTDLPYPSPLNADVTNHYPNIQKDCDGRMPVSLLNRQFIPTLIDAAKATGAFPVGLKTRLLRRPAKFIWDNPFFHKEGRFSQQTISLGAEITDREMDYVSLNSDGGTANNEPVELAQQVLRDILNKVYKVKSQGSSIAVELIDREKDDPPGYDLKNTSILLIDPFPSLTNDITVPDERSGNFPAYAWKLIKAMNSQLIFDAKDAMDAYKKENYGLHIISPSRDNAQPNHAIACGSLAGFGGFLNREFRVHDFFLGRRNCQSFLRKYFVARLDEPDPDSRACIESILDAYAKKPLACDRFSFTDEQGIRWLPIIPDVTLKQPIERGQGDGSEECIEPSRLPLYQLKKMPVDFLDRYKPMIARRFMKISNNLVQGNWFQQLLISMFTTLKKRKVTGWIYRKMMEDLSERNLIK